MWITIQAFLEDIVWSDYLNQISYVSSVQTENVLHKRA